LVLKRSDSHKRNATDSADLLIIRVALGVDGVSAGSEKRAIELQD
jgi:hypothetical protein